MTDTYTPSRLKRWTRPQHYAGASWPEYFSSGFGQSRDSDHLEASNFAVAVHELGGESDTVRIVRESHWAVGWVEWIAIHESDSRALVIADKLRESYDQYPVLDEDEFSTREYEALTDYWNQCSTRERAGHVLDQVKRYHWLKPSLMRFRRLLKSDYYPGSEDGLTRDESMVSRALEESLRD